MERYRGKYFKDKSNIASVRAMTAYGVGGCSGIYPLVFNVAVGGGEWPASLCRFTPGTP